MELLIPGLILVSLMIYASTRIKKSAAQAFEAETIDTDEFFFEKPEGFLTVLNGKPDLAYEGYSKEFGGDGAEDIKQARVQVRKIKDSSFKELVVNLSNSARVISKTSEVIDQRKYLLVEAERVEKGAGLIELYKLAETGRDMIEFKVTALEQTNEEVARKIQSMATSFFVK